MAVSVGGENRLSSATVDYKVGYTKTTEHVNDERKRVSTTTATICRRQWISAAALRDCGSPITAGRATTISCLIVS